MIKAAGFVAGAQEDQPVYNSSPITKGAMFTALKPQPDQAPEELTEEELAMAETGGCALVEEKPGLPAGVMRNIYLRISAYFIFLLVILLGASGRLDWANAWVYMAFVMVLMLAHTRSLVRRAPDLIIERMQGFGKEKIKPWDRVLVPLVAGVGPIATLLASAVEMRYHWPPPVPMGLSGAGFCVYLVSFAFVHWAMLENRFFSTVVRIQTDRGHKVVDRGPYSYVRHPGYAGAILFNLATPMALGSYWALIPAVITAALLVVRTSLEERTLVDELEEYKEYTERVRSRLIPGVW
ncbi:MAG: isoprenylcysteine carboxylmethyltransferase family protein [Nitrospinota bacterium]|nr:isoprenylcysteine carboxylmethyltransferase family protein [Nitrospinota bacterium]